MKLVDRAPGNCERESARQFLKNTLPIEGSRYLLSRVRATQFAKYFLPVILWMALIFGGSTNLGASRNTSRIIGPILRWFNPEVTDDAIRQIQFTIRKCGHVAEYGILALLVWRALRHRHSIPATGWSWKHARQAILISAFYAATDEFHQSFVVTREGSLWDVLLDTAGAAAAIFLFWRIGRRYKRW